MIERTPPIWNQADAEWYGAEGVCRICGKPMEVGQAYWLDAGMMIREPVPPFHAECATPRATTTGQEGTT